MNIADNNLSQVNEFSGSRLSNVKVGQLENMQIT